MLVSIVEAANGSKVSMQVGNYFGNVRYIPPVVNKNGVEEKPGKWEWEVWRRKPVFGGGTETQYLISQSNAEKNEACTACADIICRFLVSEQERERHWGGSE